MNNQNMIMAMTAQTSIHAGAGQALSVIDLPIQREGHTQHPVVFGSSLKGALRYQAYQTLTDDEEVLSAVFGPDLQGADSNAHAGACMISDARLLLLPVRSLNGYFKWVTCPALIRRFLKDCDRASLSIDALLLPDITLDQVAVNDSKQKTLFLEEFALTVVNASELEQISKVIHQVIGIELSQLHDQLAIVSDDMFTYLAQNSTPVNAHIALDENKTVVKGALWYEETLPPETVMYSLIMCTSSKRKNIKLTATDVAHVLTDRIIPTHNRYLQVGGNETVGMGWFAIHFTNSSQTA